jgi:hypothetical protein
LAGNTGKMTAAALAARGPRMVLGEIRFSETRSVLIIYREGSVPLLPGNYKLFTWARSYTLSYLLRIAKGMTWAK